MSGARRRVLALTGGVGGAKLALGLARVLGPGELTFLVNTGDDFEHLGLTICPDIDTLLYTLADEANPDTGWGRRDESWRCLDALGELGADTWFKLGDRDLATHLIRSAELRAGTPLSTVTERLARALNVEHTILPMSDDRIATVVDTKVGELAFQQYFVRERCEPEVLGIRFEGSDRARMPAGLEKLLADPALAGVLICPSNPYLSIDPILAVPGMRAALAASTAPVVAVSPIIQGAAVKGPTAKMMAELGVPRDAVAVARHYGSLLDGYIVDSSDAHLLAAVNALDIAAVATPTLMLTLQDKINLAQAALDFLPTVSKSAAR